jgi:hypothetical protein
LSLRCLLAIFFLYFAFLLVSVTLVRDAINTVNKLV